MRLRTKSGLSLEVVAVYRHQRYKNGRYGLQGSKDWAEPSGTESFTASLAIRSFAAELSPPIPQSSDPGRAQLVLDKNTTFTELAQLGEGRALTVEVAAGRETLLVYRLTKKEAIQRVLRHVYQLTYP